MKKIQLTDKEVTMREPKVSDLMMLDNIEGDMAKEVALIVNLCELSQSEVEEMAFPEYKKLKKEVTAFLG